MPGNLWGMSQDFLRKGMKHRTSSPDLNTTMLKTTCQMMTMNRWLLRNYYGEDQEIIRNQAYDEEIDDARKKLAGAANEIDPTEHLNEIVEPEVPETKAQDLHSVLHCMLESHVEMQDSGGLAFDMLLYKGKLHKTTLHPALFTASRETQWNTTSIAALAVLAPVGLSNCAGPVVALLT